MNTLRDYLEEETSYLPVSDFPTNWLEVSDYQLETGEFVVVSYHNPDGATYRLLEVTAGEESFVVIAHENDEWLAYSTIEDYVAQVFGSDLDYYDVNMD